MLLGKLSTSSYSKPFLSLIEKNSYPEAISCDPFHGMLPNLAESTMYSEPAFLNFDDEDLLHSVMVGRPNYSGRKPDVRNFSRRIPQWSQKWRHAMSRSFDTVKKPPVHPTKSELKPTKVAYIFPNIFHSKKEFVTLQFDPDVTVDPRDKEPGNPVRKLRGSNILAEDVPSRNTFMMTEYGEGDSCIALLSQTTATRRILRRDEGKRGRRSG